MKNNIIFFLVLIFIVICICFDFNSFDMKIELRTTGLDIEYIDKNIANVFREKLQFEKDILDIVIFSSEFGCNIYLKLKNKNNEKIKNLILCEAFKNKDIDDIKINDKYFLKYQRFLILKYTENNYLYFKELVDACIDELAKLKITENAILLGEQTFANYIYFKNNDFIKYNFDISDFEKLMENNNLGKNFFKNAIDNKNYDFIVDEKIDSINKIGNIRLKYKDKAMSSEFFEIFEMQEGLKTPKNQLILFDNTPSLVIAVSKKKLLPTFLFDFGLKKIARKYNLDIYNPKFKKQAELYFDNDFSIEACLKYIQANFSLSNALFFLGTDVPKINKNKKFDENIQNRITILCSYFDYLKIKKHSHFARLGTINQNAVAFKFNNHLLENYSIEKNELNKMILANRGGYVLGRYYKNGEQIEIIFKKNPNQKDNYIYSKEFNALISENLLVQENLKNEHRILAQENGKYFYFKKYKNPSLYRRVQLQIRYLLSLFNLTI